MGRGTLQLNSYIHLFFLAVFFFVGSIPDLNAQEKLVIIGGGKRPPEVLKKFVNWADNERILIVSWASDEPEEYTEAFLKDLSPHFTGIADASNARPQTIQQQNVFIEQLSKATGVFFTGGDQTNIMNTLEAPGGNEMMIKLQEAYSNGIVFGGTSAGTAIMSETIITGDMEEGVTPLRKGFGFLAPEIIVDQHFTQRKRKKRLLSALTQTHKNIGIGIDESTALYVTNKDQYEVAGTNQANVFVRSANDNSYLETKFSNGETFDFSKIDIQYSISTN